jgi:uncharacterized protein
VHVSQLCDRYISDPSEVVQAGDRISVRVLDVDLTRKRISLTARKNTAAAGAGSSGVPPREQRPDARPSAGRRPSVAPQPRAFTSNPFANL